MTCPHLRKRFEPTPYCPPIGRELFIYSWRCKDCRQKGQVKQWGTVVKKWSGPIAGSAEHQLDERHLAQCAAIAKGGY